MGETAVGLSALEAEIRRDLADLTLPRPNWPMPRTTQDGQAIHDVIVVGAGHCGLLAGAALIFRGIHNIAILDRAPKGREGIWFNSARMPTLRSPKSLPGLTMGLPNLTFRRWFEALHGAAAWQAVDRFPTDAWGDYMAWFRHVLDLPVANEISVTEVLPAEDHLLLMTSAGAMRARRVVWATGGTSSLANAVVPDGVARDLWPDRAAHSCEAIDFTRMAGRSVAVIGAGASAFDNAHMALTHGAARVDLYVRAPHLHQVNRYIPYLQVAGLAAGWPGMSDADRWAMSVLVFRQNPSPPTPESVKRLLAFANVAVHFRAPVRSATRAADGVALKLADRDAQVDFLIIATGFRSQFARLPELRALAPHVALWRDRYTPPPALADADLAGQAYLDEGLALTERDAGACPQIRRLHVFSRAGEVSVGSMVSNIANANLGAERIASAITRALAAEDAAHLRGLITGFEQPEFAGTEFYVPEQVPFRPALG